MAPTEQVLSQRELQRAVLARQLLLDRANVSLPQALERVAGLQSQYAPTMYVGLWSRDGFQRDDLTATLHRREVVQATLMRATIHLVSAADYWPLALAIRPARQRWWLQSTKGNEVAARDAAERVRRALELGEQLTRKELDQIAGKGSVNGVGFWLNLGVRVPPSGTWERRRADLFAAATDWVGPEPQLAYDDAVDHLVQRYLTGFGPAAVHEIANWAGMTVTEIAPFLERVKLRRFRTEDGQIVVDLLRLPLPDPDTPAPVRFLSTWEAILLVHARRAVVLREGDRFRIFHTKIPHSMDTFLVDGVVEGTWRYGDGRVDVTPWNELDKLTLAAVHDEAERVAAFHR